MPLISKDRSIASGAPAAAIGCPLSGATMNHANHRSYDAQDQPAQPVRPGEAR